MKSNIYYRNNENLKAENINIDYEVWQVKEIQKCFNDPVYFIKNYVKIVTPKGLELFDLRDYQEKIVHLIDKEKRIIYMSGRQSGKTASAAAYIVHYIIFNSYKRVAILANKEATSKEIFDRVQLTFEHLPIWLKCGIKEWNKKSMLLDNGSSVIIGSTSSSSISGKSINLLYIDEAALISKQMANDFFDSILPVVSADPEAKIVISSTPKKLNHFYRMWKDAVSGKSGYKYLKVEWWEVPGRDEKFKEKIINEKGIEHWEQEYAVEFLGSGGSLLSSKTLKSIVTEDPLEVRMNGKFRIFKYPEKNKSYIVFVDVGEGIGKDDSVCQIIDISVLPYEQVAVYQDNEIKPRLFNVVIDKLGKYYNEALVVIETNSCGQEVANNLNYESEYENIFYDKDFGIKTTKLTKKIGCGEFKSMMETMKIKIRDEKTLTQLANFSDNGKGSYGSEDGDDLVMPFIIFSYWINRDEYVSNWLDIDDVSNKHNKELIEELDGFLILMDYDD